MFETVREAVVSAGVAAPRTIYYFDLVEDYPHIGGVVEFSRNLRLQLARRFGERLVAVSGLAATLDCEDRTEAYLTRERRAIRRLAALDPQSIFYIPNFQNPLDRVPGAPRPSVVNIVHDVQFALRPAPFAADDLAWLHAAFAETRRNADHVVFVSETTRRDFTAAFGVPARSTVVPPPLADIVAAGDVAEPSPFLLAVQHGECHPHKNVDGLLRLFTALASADPHVTLRVAGRGGDAFDRAADALPATVRARVEHVGFVPRDVLDRLHRHAAAFVSLSHFEGFNMAAAEAARCGTPLILSDLPAHRELFSEVACFLDPDRPNATAAADYLRTSAPVLKGFAWSGSSRCSADSVGAAHGGLIAALDDGRTAVRVTTPLPERRRPRADSRVARLSASRQVASSAQSIVRRRLANMLLAGTMFSGVVALGTLASFDPAAAANGGGCAGASSGNGGTGGSSSSGAAGGLGGTGDGTVAAPGCPGTPGGYYGGGGGGGGPGASAGGAGGTGTTGNGGDGGDGGADGSNGAALTNTGVLRGGNGGDGLAADGGGGGGGGGGYGRVVTGTAGTLTNSGNGSLIAGGHGGAGGNGTNGSGGNGGAGGVGVSFAGTGGTLINNGSISGGNGGAGGAAGTSVGSPAFGGIGVVGGGLTIVNSGTIGGGLSGGTPSAAPAINFLSGTNTLTMQQGGSVGGINIAAGSLTVGADTAGDQPAASVTLGGVITGSGSLVSTGALLILTGTNTYAGGTTIDGGMLRVSNAAGDGSSSSIGVSTGGLTLDNGGILQATAPQNGVTPPALTLSNAITVNTGGGGVDSNGATLILSGVISDPLGGDGGQLTVTDSAGGGVLALTGTNTYSGGTVLSGGTLVVDNANGLTSSSIGVGPLTLDGGTLRADVGTTLNLANAIAINAAGGTVDTNSNTLTLSGQITDGNGAGSLTVINSSSVSDILILSNANNTYSGGTVITGGAAVQLGADGALGTGGLAFTGAGTLDLAGFNQALTTLNGTEGIIGDSGLAFASGNTPNTLTVLSGSFGGTIQDRNPDGTASNYYGQIQLIKNADPNDPAGLGGTLSLSGRNTYSRGTIVNGGILSLAHATPDSSAPFTSFIDAAGGNTITLSGGALELAVTGTLSNQIAVTSGFVGIVGAAAGTVGTLDGFLTVDSSSTLQIGSAIDTGTIVFDTTTTYTGATIVAGGVLEIAAGGSINNSASLQNNATVQVDAGGSASFTGDITNAGQLTVAGTLSGATLLNQADGTVTSTGTIAVGTFTNAGTASVAGTLNATTVNNTGSFAVTGPLGGTIGTFAQQAGTFDLGAQTVTVGTLTLSGGTVQNGTLSADAFALQSGTVSAVLTGAGTLTKTTAGLVTLSAANSYTGGTVLSSGTLAIGVSNALSTGGITFNGGALQLAANVGPITNAATLAAPGGTIDTQGFAVTYAGTIGGAGALTKLGAGTLTLTGANTYSGGTLLDQGTIAIGTAGALGTGGLSMDEGTTLQFTASFALANAIAFTGIVDPTIDTGPNNDTINGMISGPGALTKLGTGTLTLTANNPYTGATTVGAGTLVVNGSDPNSPVTVDNGATLGGTGTVGGFTAQAGSVVAPGVASPYGTLNVAGPLAFAAGSTYRDQINAAGQTDRIAGTGTGALGSAALQLVDMPGSYSTASRYIILTAAGGLAGTRFGNVTLTSPLAFLTPTLTYSPTTVTLSFAGNGATFPSVGLTQNQVNVAQAIQSLGPGSPLYNAILGLTPAGARQAFNAASGSVFSSTSTTAVQDGRQVGALVFDRLWNLGGGELDARQLLDKLAPGDLPTFVRCFAPMDQAPKPAPTTYAIWGEGFGDFGHDGGNGNGATLDRSVGGFVFGLDTPIHALGAPMRIGVAGGYSNDSFGGEHATSNGTFGSAFGAVYGGARFGAIDVRLAASGASNSTDVTRRVIFPGFNETEHASYGGVTAQGFAEIGYRVASPRLVIEPVVDGAVTHVHQDGFRETGGAAALATQQQDTDVGTTTLGVRTEAAPFNGLPLVARAFVGWQHAFGDLSPVSRLAFEAGSLPFTSVGAPLDSDAFVSQAGLDWRYSSRLTLALSYLGQIGWRDSDNGVKGRMEYKF